MGHCEPTALASGCTLRPEEAGNSGETTWAAWTKSGTGAVNQRQGCVHEKSAHMISSILENKASRQGIKRKPCDVLFGFSQNFPLITRACLLGNCRLNVQAKLLDSRATVSRQHFKILDPLCSPLIGPIHVISHVHATLENSTCLVCFVAQGDGNQYGNVC